MSDLILRGVGKSYVDDIAALKPLDLIAQPGELIVLVGPSGCGKSTLLKLIAGLEKVHQGQVILAGRDITHCEPRHRGIAMVFQNYALYPHLTVRDNLAYPLRRARVSATDIASKVMTVATQLGLEALLDRRPSQLSGGQKQRVAMGRAIIRQPALFLLDEPLSNLDAALRTHVRGEIRALQRKLGTTMLYVTHDQVEAQTLADRIVILREGEIQQIGQPQEIYRRPANMFSAAFLGSAPPNFFLGRLAGGRVAAAGSSIRLSDLPAEIQTALAGRDEIYLGIRPESLSPRGGAPARGLTLTGTVSRVECVGDVRHVYFRSAPDGSPPAPLASLSGRQATDERLWTAQGAEAPDQLSLFAGADDILFFGPDGRAIGGHNGEFL